MLLSIFIARMYASASESIVMSKYVNKHPSLKCFRYQATHHIKHATSIDNGFADETTATKPVALLNSMFYRIVILRNISETNLNYWLGLGLQFSV
jgi:hypothetical protein